MSFPIIKHFFVSLFAVVHAAAFAPISWHRAQGAFIPRGATAERCIMVMCSLGRSWYRGLWDKKTTERNKEPDLIEANVSWACGCLEGRRREGAILVHQRCQWSAAQAGVTSASRLHDATNGYLSMKHDVAKQGANEMVPHEVDLEFFDQRISLAVVTIPDEEAKLTFWRDQVFGLEMFVLRASL